MPLLSFALLLALSAPAPAVNTGEPRREAELAMNTAYRAAIARLPTAAGRALLQEQRTWLGTRDTACAREAGPVHRDLCLERTALDRTAVLERIGRDVVAPPVTAATADGKPGGKPDVGPCDFSRLPAGFTVQAVGVYEGGTPVDLQLDSSGHDTQEVEVLVNLPDQDVVLVLMAYDPVLWRIRRTGDTRIATVIVGGYHGQAVIGIERDTPLSITTYSGERKDCERYFYAYKVGPELLQADAIVQELTGRAIDRFRGDYSAARLLVGAAPPAGVLLLSPNDLGAEVYAASTARPPAGQRGLDALVAAGTLRRAAQTDIDAWITKASERYRRFDPDLRVEAPFRADRSYVVLRAMEFPAGLFGAHSVTFLLAPGVPEPTGNPGHSSVYRLADGSCRGPGCREH